MLSILGQVAEWIDSSLDALGLLFEPYSVYKYGFFSLKPKGSSKPGCAPGYLNRVKGAGITPPQKGMLFNLSL